MASDQTAGRLPSPAPRPVDELERALTELRQANERLVVAGVRMQELADEAQRARDEAEAASRAKDDFLAALSHELRTPLNAILGWTRMLRRGTITGAAADRALEIVERNATLQARLIADLLDVSQIITGQLRLDVEPVDLARVVDGGVEALRPAAAVKTIQIESHVEPDVPPVLADSTRAQQIIWNVLANAIKFTPRGGRVDVTLKQVGATAAVAVRDSGVGIDADLLPHVFDRFRQGDRGAIGGLGLGLAVVRQLMELHGGTVDADSAGPGRGATFTLVFPIPEVAVSTVPPARTAELLPLQGLRVLVVEEECDSRQWIEALLTDSGATVTAVTSAREAVARCDEDYTPDLLIANIGLPDRDGCDLVRQVRALGHRRHKAIPAVALTGCVRPEDRERALAAGFQLHVAKPDAPDALVDVVARLAGRA